MISHEEQMFNLNVSNFFKKYYKKNYAQGIFKYFLLEKNRKAKF